MAISLLGCEHVQKILNDVRSFLENLRSILEQHYGKDGTAQNNPQVNNERRRLIDRFRKRQAMQELGMTVGDYAQVCRMKGKPCEFEPEKQEQLV